LHRDPRHINPCHRLPYDTGQQQARAGFGGDPVELGEQQFLGGHVYAAGRGDGHDQHRVAGQRPDHGHLLLVAAGQLADRLAETGRHQGQPPGQRCGPRLAAPGADEAEAGDPVGDRHDDVLGRAEQRHEPVHLPVLGDVADVGPQRPGPVPGPQHVITQPYQARVGRGRAGRIAHRVAQIGWITWLAADWIDRRHASDQGGRLAGTAETVLFSVEVLVPVKGMGGSSPLGHDPLPHIVRFSVRMSPG